LANKDAHNKSAVQLLSTAEEVSKLQEELEQMKPLLADAVQESIVTMQRISEDTVRQNQ